MEEVQRYGNTASIKGWYYFCSFAE